MNAESDQSAGKPTDTKHVAILCGLSVAALWLAQPPLGFWPAVTVALLPWLHLARDTKLWTRRTILTIWVFSALYFLVSLQGLRHAHPLMIFPTLALAGYLAVYHVLFLVLLRRVLRRSESMLVLAPVLWVGMECIRNYLLTGISALMLAHTMTEVPITIQIADLFGSYGVSFVLVALNVAVDAVIRCFRESESRRARIPVIAIGVGLVVGTLGYGNYRLQQPLAGPTSTFALIQRSEPIEYVQSDSRAIEIFQAYLQQTQQAVAASDSDIQAIVWPESMFTAGLPWMTLAADARVPEDINATIQEFETVVNSRQRDFIDRVLYAQSAIRQPSGDTMPDLLVGCGVVRYSTQPEVYSGLMQIDGAGDVADWYGKTHLVMFGEYIPIAPWIPWVRDLIPPGMGLTIGPGPKLMNVNDTNVLPLICIETAVERVAVKQLSKLSESDQTADVIVTVTNDGWFDDSSVVEHHLRCGQLVAVATRCPVLSAANNGPTAWIDSNGRIVERLAVGDQGHLVASPNRDERESYYVRLGALPAWLCVMISLLVPFMGRRKTDPNPQKSD